METKTCPFEIKSINEMGFFKGYAAIFNIPDSTGEVIEEGAFTKTLKEKSNFPILWYHDPKEPIGIISEIEEDEKGLKIEGQLNLQIQAGREKYALMKQGAIKGLSIGFRTIRDFWDKGIRHLKEIALYEVSHVTFQAHPEALISVVKDESFDEFEGKNVISQIFDKIIKSIRNLE